MKNRCIVLCMTVFTLVGIASCSKETLDSASRDTTVNILRANKWFDVVKTTVIADEESTEILVGNDDGDRLEFKSDGFAYIYRAGGQVDDGIPYQLSTNKVMTFDGVEYTIKENLIQTVTRFTLERTDGDKYEKIEFKRR